MLSCCQIRLSWKVEGTSDFGLKTQEDVLTIYSKFAKKNGREEKDGGT